MSNNKEPIRPYEADGIKEYDNPMPKWWLGLFFFTIVFAAIYVARYEFLGGPSLKDELADASSKAAQPPASANATTDSQGGQNANGSNPSQAPNDPKARAAKWADPSTIASGKSLFQANCAACHGALGEGNIGPNLTDDHWIHGGSDESIMNSITNGVLDKGMPPWGPVLGNEKVEQISAFVASLQGSNPPNPKAPQGEVFKRP